MGSILKCFIFAAIFYSISQPLVMADGLSQQMDYVFNNMTHYTGPQVISSQNRGIFVGGHYVAKSRITNENLLSLSPPSWKGGCGGIDMFGGAFSYINRAEFAQLLRSVLANSVGYSFQLALDNVFPEGAKWLESMQRKIQALNQHMGDSCQLAQGLVNDLTSGMDIKHKTDASLAASMNGLYQDAFGAKHAAGNNTPLRNLKNNRNKIYSELTGNIVWKQLIKHSIAKWFRDGDHQLMESMMSLTGTVVIGESGEEAEPAMEIFPGNKITLNDLVEGGTVKIYSCGEDQDFCLVPKLTTIKLKGLRVRILELLTPSTGIIPRYAQDSGKLLDHEAAFLANLPASFGTMIRNLSVKSSETATLFANDSSAALALAMAYELADTMINTTILAQSNSSSSYKKEVTALLDRCQTNLREEYRVLSKTYGTVGHLMANYNQLLPNLPKSQYILFHDTPTSRRALNSGKEDA